MTLHKIDEVEPPDAVYVRQRWIPLATVEWVKGCDRIMVEHGAVTGSTIYQERHQARHRARKLIRLMVELRLHDREQLVEHVGLHSGGYVWTVEYRGGIV